MKQPSQNICHKIIDLKVSDFLWVESFNGFVTVLDGFTTVHKASFGRIIMTDLGRRRRTLGLERVERVVLEQEIGCLAWLGR